MARTERLVIGSTPLYEEWAPAGSPCYETQARIECAAYKEQLRRFYLSCHETRLPCRLEVKEHPREYGDGTITSVVAVYTPGTRGEQAALWLGTNSPDAWDADAFLLLRETVFAEHLRDIATALGHAPEVTHDGESWLVIDPETEDVLGDDIAVSSALDQAREALK
jgi:hypothetical protein